jgi:glutamine synthetase
MLGSSSSVANPNIILNTAVAESLRQFYEKLKDVPADEMESAVHELLKQTIIDHKRVIFNGNGYTDEWLEEAKKRGLYNLVSTPDALPHFIDEKNEKLLTSHHIFTDAELHSRYEIKMENYVKTLHIEANTLVEIIQKDLLPSITTYMEKLAQTASLKKSVVPGISVSAEASLLSRLTELAETMTKDLETLKADTAMAEYEVDKDLLKSAKLYQSVVLTDMEKVRVSADAAEALIPDSILPYPTYGKLLFSISD